MEKTLRTLESLLSCSFLEVWNFSLINNKKDYAAFLFVLSMDKKGREEKSVELQKLVTEEIGK